MRAMRINNTETYLEPVSVSVDLVCSRTINHWRIGESSQCTESFISNNKKNITVKSYSHPKFFHNSRLFGWIQQKKIYKTFRGLTRDWTQINCLAVSHSNYYTGMFSMFVWGYNWILFMNGWFCPIHLIRRKSLHFEKK